MFFKEDTPEEKPQETPEEDDEEEAKPKPEPDSENDDGDDDEPLSPELSYFAPPEGVSKLVQVRSHRHHSNRMHIRPLVVTLHAVGG